MPLGSLPTQADWGAGRERPRARPVRPGPRGQWRVLDDQSSGMMNVWPGKIKSGFLMWLIRAISRHETP